MVVAYDSDIDPYFVVKVTEDLVETTEVEEGVPTGTFLTAARIWIPWGFQAEFPLLVEQIMTGTAPDETWTGKYKVTFTQPVRKAIGPNTCAKFAFDFWIEGDLERIRVAFGDVVFRR